MKHTRMEATCILHKDEVNTGRQLELDIAKGFLMVLILLIHSFQVLADDQAISSVIYKGVFSFFELTGATLYLFTLGFGSAYSRRNSPRELAVSGIRLVAFQGLSNLCYGLCLMIPHFLLTRLITLPQANEAIYAATLEGMLTFVNIFFIAGMGYLALSLLKTLSCPLWGYVAISIVVALTSPWLAAINSDNLALSWLLDMSFGGAGRTSFCFYPYLSFVLTGYVFAMILRRVSDKRTFYKKGLMSASIVLSVWLAYSVGTYPTLDAWAGYLEAVYRVPDLVKYAGSTAAILLTFALIDRMMAHIQRFGWLHEKLLYLSKHISKYYAVHIGVLLVMASLYGYKTISTTACVVCFVPCTLITHAIVVHWNERFAKRK